MRRPNLLAGVVGLSAASLLALPALSSARNAPEAPAPVKLDILAINDFHGQLEKLDAARTSSGRINSTPAGGGEYLATHLTRLRAEAAAKGAASVTVAAGDLIGATPLLSAAFHDEPTIEALNLMGLQITSVGNHEFDEGYNEVLRMQNGGCLPDGTGANNQNSCPDPAAPFPGASFSYLAANVKYTGTDRTILPAYTIKKYGGIKVAFIGMTLKQTPDIVTKSGVEGLTFTDEVETVNALVPALRDQGVRAMVVLLHQGGVPSDPTKYDGCAGVVGPGVDIAKALDPAIDVVITGHTHQAYNCTVLDPAGNPRLLTSASSLGRLVTRVSVELNPKTRDVIRTTAAAKNTIVTNSDGTAPTPTITTLIAKYRALVASIADKVLGQIAPTGTVNAITRTADADGSGDSPLGNLIADGQRADPTVIAPGGRAPQIVLMNPGGIRADLLEDASGNVTYAAAFNVQPFNNYVVSMDLTGAQVLAVLNQQWNNPSPGANRVLQVSGLSYTFQGSLVTPVPAASNTNHVLADTVMVDADVNPTSPMVPLDPAATYRVAVNSFLSDGGDGFSVLAAGTNKYFGGLDIDSLANYMTANSPTTPTATDRITVVP
jgi:5'-nucleotidase